MAKLWDKNYSLNGLLEEFTVGEDYLLDAKLVAADCTASLAHAAMLEKIGILEARELADLKRELCGIISLQEKGRFPILPGDEDCHTAIENHLVKKLGDTGKKIHTGRSRNDQVIAALRLYAREYMLEFEAVCLQLIDALVHMAREHAETPMPGRTHMQIAMPSSVGLWAAAYAEELADDLKLLHTAYEINNCCPLGSAASYGVPLPLDREFTARLLGFARVQNNVLYVNNSRGKIESIILDAAEQTVLTLSKLAQDLILYTMPEFAYFSLPDELCTGSSIMPQKKNPDGLELLRARSATVSSCTLQVKNIIRSLPSGYNRDFQETKAPFIKGLHLAAGCVQAAKLSIEKLKVHPGNLRKGFIPEIYAADYALQLVRQGKPFRDAYREVGRNLDKLQNMDPVDAIKAKTHTGAPCNLNLPYVISEKDRMLKANGVEKARVAAAVEQLTGMDVRLFA